MIFDFQWSNDLLHNQKTRAWLLSLAAMVLTLMCGQNLFAQFDPPLELKWEVQNIGKYNEQFAVSPDESIFVATHQKDSTATIRVYDMANGTLLRQFPDHNCYKHFAFFPDNKHLAITGWSCNPKTWARMGKIRIMDLENGIVTDSIDFPDSLKNEGADDIAVSPNGKYLAVSISLYYDDLYIVYNTDDWSILARISLKNGSPSLSAFSPDSKYFFFNDLIDTYKDKYFFEMLNMETKEIKTIHKADNAITDIKFSKDSTKMLFAREDKILGIYHFSDSKLETIALDEKYDYVDRNLELIRNNILLFSSGLGMRLLNIETSQIFMVTTKRAGSITLLKDNNSFCYLGSVYSGVVKGLDKIISSVDAEENTELLFPNPTTNILTLQTSGLIMPEQIQIFDINGKNIDLSKENITIMNDEILINVSNLEMGTFFLNIQNGTKQNTYKFIVGR